MFFLFFATTSLANKDLYNLLSVMRRMAVPSRRKLGCLIAILQRRRSGSNFGVGQFQSLEGKQRPEDGENCHYIASCLAL